jgi:hypothetical protein
VIVLCTHSVVYCLSLSLYSCMCYTATVVWHLPGTGRVVLQKR